VNHRAVDISQDRRRLDDLGPRVLTVASTLGVLGLLGSILSTRIAEGGTHRFYFAYLINFSYFLSLALGALFFVMLQHLTRSGWSVVVRRLAEGLAATLPLLAVLCIPVLVGIHDLYHWSHPGAVASDALLQGKQSYLNVPFFVGRLAAAFIVWSALAWFFFRTSVRQDRTGETALTLRMQAVSGPAMVVFAITLTFAAFDLLMSLDPHWYSTIFGVYYFSGGVVGFFALLALVTVVVQATGRLTRAVTVEHYQDLGKLIFAFVVFWAYIAFSQYLLIWYANIPEETRWFLRRQTGAWTWISLALLFGHFVVPFLLLISRHPKRRKATLTVAAVWVLLMHWLDIYWLVMPSAHWEGLDEGSVPVGLPEVAGFVGIGGLFVAAAVYALRNGALVPERDPRLPESLAFENV
jgi:hypothetical protein